MVAMLAIADTPCSLLLRCFRYSCFDADITPLTIFHATTAALRLFRRHHFRFLSIAA